MSPSVNSYGNPPAGNNSQKYNAVQSLFTAVMMSTCILHMNPHVTPQRPPIQLVPALLLALTDKYPGAVSVLVVPGNRLFHPQVGFALIQFVDQLHLRERTETEVIK